MKEAKKNAKANAKASAKVNAKANAKANAKESAKATVHRMNIEVAFGLPRESANRLAASIYEDIMNDIAPVIAEKAKYIVKGIEESFKECVGE